MKYLPISLITSLDLQGCCGYSVVSLVPDGCRSDCSVVAGLCSACRKLLSLVPCCLPISCFAPLASWRILRPPSEPHHPLNSAHWLGLLVASVRHCSLVLWPSRPPASPVSSSPGHVSGPPGLASAAGSNPVRVPVWRTAACRHREVFPYLSWSLGLSWTSHPTSAPPSLLQCSRLFGELRNARSVWRHHLWNTALWRDAPVWWFPGQKSQCAWRIPGTSQSAPAWAGSPDAVDPRWPGLERAACLTSNTSGCGGGGGGRRERLKPTAKSP